MNLSVVLYLDKWTLLATELCYMAKGSAYASFKIQRNVTLRSIRLEHVSGLISCSKNNPKFGSSIWTCNADTTQLSTFITDDKNNIIFPPGVTIHPIVASIIFKDKSVFTMTSQFLTYHGPEVSVTEGTEFRIWNANDLGGDHYDLDNIGKHCVNVYGNFAV